MSIPLRRIWTQQPQRAVGINWASPFARGLATWATPFDNIGVPGPVAYGKSGTGMRGGTIRGGPIRVGVYNSTVLCVDQCLGTDLSGWWVSGDACYTDTSNEWPGDLGLKLLSTQSYGKMQLAARNSGGTVITTSFDVFDGNLNIGDTLIRVGTISPTGYVNAWGNGVKSGSTSSELVGHTFDLPSVSAAAPGFGLKSSALSSGASKDSVTYQSLVLRWARVLSDFEIAALSLNPWQIFMPEDQWIFYEGKISVPPEPPAILVPSWARNSNRILSGVM